MIPASQPACVLVRDQASINCGRSAGIVEYPASPRISAPQIAATIAAEGPAGAALAELTVYQFRSMRVDHNGARVPPITRVAVTAYLEAGGTLENAQAMAAHESPRTTKLYDRTGDEITLDEVERITI